MAEGGCFEKLLICLYQCKTALPYYFFDDCFFCYHDVNTPLNLDILGICVTTREKSDSEVNVDSKRDKEEVDFVGKL